MTRKLKVDEICLIAYRNEAVLTVIASAWPGLDDFDLVGFVIGSF